MEENKFLSLKETQQEQAKMLKKLADFCKENDLTYYLTGGTLLGAIRHKGFIPWDDDIDVVMPRPDYDRLHQIVKEKKYHIDDNLILRSLQYNNLLLPFSKIMNTKLKMETHFYENEYDNYLWIDIFPMDGLPESDKKINTIYKKIWFLRRLLGLAVVKDDIIENESKKKWMILPKKIARLFLSHKIAIRRIIKKMDKISRKYDFKTSKYVGGVMWGYGPQEKLLREEVTDAAEVEFENMKFTTYGCYEKYLTNIYGNYMELPPVEQRITHQIKVYRIGE